MGNNDKHIINFKQVFNQDNLPEKDKEKVLDLIDTATFLLNIVDLFTLKQIEATSVVCQTFLDSSLDKKLGKSED